MARKLKVNRTPIGFHDAHAEATSQKKALMAWDADIDLFARGVADTATDEALTGQPLQRPERIVRRARCTAGNALRKWRE